MSDLPSHLKNLLTAHTATVYVERRMTNRLGELTFPGVASQIRKMTFRVADHRADNLYNATYFGLLRATGVNHE